MLDWSSGASKAASLSSVALSAAALISPSGRLSAQESGAAGKSRIAIGGIEGDAARTCDVSADFHQPLEFSPDERHVLATSATGDEHRLLICSVEGGAVRAWSAVTVAERAREALRIRLHGRAPWLIDFARFSPDARRILSGRIDGKIELWSAEGRRLDSETIAGYSPGSMRPRFGFGKDGTVFQLGLSPRSDDARTRFVVSSLFPEKPRFEIVHDAHSLAASTLDALQFRAIGRGLVLFHVRSSSIAIVTVPEAGLLAEIPARETVTGVAIGTDGAWVAVAHPGRIDLWQLQKSGPCATNGDAPASSAK